MVPPPSRRAGESDSRNIPVLLANGQERRHRLPPLRPVRGAARRRPTSVPPPSRLRPVASVRNLNPRTLTCHAVCAFAQTTKPAARKPAAKKPAAKKPSAKKSKKLVRTEQSEATANARGGSNPVYSAPQPKVPGPGGGAGVDQLVAMGFRQSVSDPSPLVLPLLLLPPAFDWTFGWSSQLIPALNHRLLCALCTELGWLRLW